MLRSGCPWRLLPDSFPLWGAVYGRFADATSITIEMVRKFADQTGFAVHPRRWVVECTFAWINRNRRLAKDFEHSI